MIWSPNIVLYSQFSQEVLEGLINETSLITIVEHLFCMLGVRSSTR
jgi:hypothetical protein